MIGYVCQAVILLAGSGFILLMVRAIRREPGLPESTNEFPAELVGTQPIGVVTGVHLAQRRAAPGRRSSVRRRPAVRV